jgi:hypothetical protein
MSDVTIGRIGNASAFCFFSSAAASAVNGWPALRTVAPPLATRSPPASYEVSSGSSQATVRLTLRYGVSMKP